MQPVNYNVSSEVVEAWAYRQEIEESYDGESWITIPYWKVPTRASRTFYRVKLKEGDLNA